MALETGEWNAQILLSIPIIPTTFCTTRGSAISRIVGANVKENTGFNQEVKMWVFEEIVDGRKLTEIINETHENVKYLKGFDIPENVVSSWSWISSHEHCFVSIFVV